MTTITLQGNYNLKWRFKAAPHIQITTDKKVINVKTSREIKQTSNGGYSVGYWIGRKFITLDNVNSIVELIPDDFCPF